MIRGFTGDGRENGKQTKRWERRGSQEGNDGVPGMAGFRGFPRKAVQTAEGRGWDRGVWGRGRRWIPLWTTVITV